MIYRALSPELHTVADYVGHFLVSDWGIPAARLRVEEAIEENLSYATTLHAVATDHHWVCIEVSDGRYRDALDNFVLECKNRILPVMLYLAVPAGTCPLDDVKRASRHGVGIIEVSQSGSCAVFPQALCLSLSGVREPLPTQFPRAYRQAVASAVATFKGGDPAKGCSRVFDELEAATRRLAKRAAKKRAWRKLKGDPAPDHNWETVNWDTVCRELCDHLDAGKLGRPKLTDSLLARVRGVTGHRNESGHKPSGRARLAQRDRELRTRFESACDLLSDFVKASG